MQTNGITLPDAFQDLAPYAKIWGVTDSQSELYLIRQSSSMAELQEYYDAIVPRLKAIFEYLDQFSLDDMPAPAALLFRTVNGLTEVGQAIEVFGQPRVPYAPFPYVVDIAFNDHSATYSKSSPQKNEVEQC